ncbi:integumentary mucin C.1-like [Drosophila kikkawai]|uniref:Integumentary mucin C.1-like n=1 Tax=Drosophila kikkawai TaxID=30033 RepID=A0A6P4HXH2_DROKI|nr:protein new-glue 1-like [Drosophila kikkawai]
MKFLFVAILIVLAIQLAASQTTTTTEAATTTTTTTTAASTTATTTTTTSSPNKIKCNRSNNWCHTRIPKKKCKNPKRCIKTVVVVTRRRG